MKCNHLIILLVSALLLIGCSTDTKDPTAGFHGQAEGQIYCGGAKAIAQQRFGAAVKHFEALDALYPFGPYAEQADLYLIYAYFQSDDIPSAAAAADRFIHLYPRDPHVDYAYYMKGLANFQQDRSWVLKYFPTDLTQRDPGCARQSFNDFCTLIRLFPGSIYVADARQHMVYLRNLYAAYELHVAEYYLRRGAFVAAANRANYIIQHYDGTPAVECALAVLVRSYNALNLPPLANQAMAVLELNYPNGPGMQSLYHQPRHYFWHHYI